MARLDVDDHSIFGDVVQRRQQRETLLIHHHDGFRPSPHKMGEILSPTG